MEVSLLENKFNVVHSNHYLDVHPTSKILIDGEIVLVSSLPSVTIDGDIYYKTNTSDSTKALEGINYVSGDELYIKHGESTTIIKYYADDYVEYRARRYSYNSNSKTFNKNYTFSYIEIF